MVNVTFTWGSASKILEFLSISSTIPPPPPPLKCPRLLPFWQSQLCTQGLLSRCYSRRSCLCRGKDKGKDDKRAKKKATTGAAVGDDSVGVSSKRGDKTSDKNKSEEGASATGRTGKGQGRRKEDDGGDDDDDDDKKPDLTNKSEEDNKGLASLLGAYESDSDDGSA